MTQKQVYKSDPKKLMEDIETLKKLNTQFETELAMIAEQEAVLLKTLGPGIDMNNLESQIAQLSSDIQTSVDALNIPEDLIDGYNSIRKAR